MGAFRASGLDFVVKAIISESADRGQVIMQRLTAHNYVVHWRVLTTRDYNSPQARPASRIESRMQNAAVQNAGQLQIHQTLGGRYTLSSPQKTARKETQANILKHLF